MGEHDLDLLSETRPELIASLQDKVHLLRFNH